MGRYSKRERAKFVKNYSASDLDAILGGKAGATSQYDDFEDDDDTAAGALLPEGMSFMPVLAEVRAIRPAHDATSSSSDEDDEAAATAAAKRRTLESVR